MITYSIIQKSQLEGARRLDAEYYQPEYLDVGQKISDFGKYFNFGDLIEKFNSGKNWPQKTSGKIKFIRTQHIRDILIRDEDDLTFCDGEPPKASLLSEGDLLFVRVGGVSDNVVSSRDYNGHFYSDNVLRIRLKKLNPFFVSVFLNSYYGKSQLERVMKGVAQPLISRENFERLKIPEPSLEFQKEIESYVLQAYDFRNRSLDLYSQAENLLLEELGLKDFKVEDDLSYIVNLSEVKSANRADAEYFQPKYEKILEKIKIQNVKKLGELARRVKTKIRPKAETIYRYIEISDISIGSGDINFSEIIGKELPANARIPIEGGELIISKVRPTRGAISIVPSEFNNRFICSSAFSVFQVSEIFKEFLFVVLRSIIGKLQFEKPTTGTSYPTITDDDVEKVSIPILPKLTQQKIADLVQKSHEARKEAKKLLELAKRKVEELIEK